MQLTGGSVLPVPVVVFVYIPRKAKSRPCHSWRCCEWFFYLPVATEVGRKNWCDLHGGCVLMFGLSDSYRGGNVRLCNKLPDTSVGYAKWRRVTTRWVRRTTLNGFCHGSHVFWCAFTSCAAWGYSAKAEPFFFLNSSPMCKWHGLMVLDHCGEFNIDAKTNSGHS